MNYQISKRKILTITALLSFLSAGQTVAVQTEKLLDVQIFGFNVADLHLRWETDKNRYRVSSFGRSKGLINLFHKTQLFSYAEGEIMADGRLYPSLAKMSWISGKKTNEINIGYAKNIIEEFSLTLEDKKTKKGFNPLGISDTVDPVSSLKWFMIDKDEKQICKGGIKIFDGIRLVTVSFNNLKKKQAQIVCNGIFLAEDRSKANTKQKRIKFQATYYQTASRTYSISSVTYISFLGKTTIKIYDKNSKLN